MHGWAPEVIGAVGTPNTSPDAYLDVFFARSASSRQASTRKCCGACTRRTEDRDAATTWQTREAQYDAVCTWGIPDHALLERLAAIEMPVFVANGDSDPMILPHYSYLLAGLIPHARVTIYPDAAHGFLFQHHAEFAADIDAFLTTNRLLGTLVERAAWLTGSGPLHPASGLRRQCARSAGDPAAVRRPA